MKISHIETFLGPKHAVVRVMTDDGAEGFGQTAPSMPAVTVQVLHDLVAPHFLGQDPWDLQRLVGRCLTLTYKFPGTFIHRALCGIETALWDLLGQVTGQPVCRLLGGLERATIPVYASSMRRDIAPEDEAARMAALVERHGFQCVKVKIGGRTTLDRDASPGRTERLIPLMREALGDGIAISADANGSYSPAEAIRIGRLLERSGYQHFEEPCPFAQIENTAQVAAALDIPVAGGEQDYSLEQFSRMIAIRAVDIVQPDIGYIGGMTRARRVAEMAELAGLPCTPHSSGSTLLRVFTLHLAAAMPACHQWQEWGIEGDPLAAPLWEPALPVVDGKVAVPTGPGWGVTVSPDYLATTARQVSRN
jgi:L-alanine-DL-glutamate epimerase-like enolase superfamily enzyme